MLFGGAMLLATAALPEHTIVAGGDVNLGRFTHLALDAPPAQRWMAPIAEPFREADLAMVNLECVVGTRGRFHRKPENRPFYYRARPEMLEALTSLGIDLVAIGNNHTMDYGPTALVEQLELLDRVGIAWAGGGRTLREALTPAYVQVGDTVIAAIGVDASTPSQRWFSATATEAGAVHATNGPAVLALLRPAIEEARRHAHIVIVSPHWGPNWSEGPDEVTRDLAHSLVEAGADLVLGHSSHHVHGVEVHQGKLIVYDMGSIMFDRVMQNRMRKSFVFRVVFTSAGPKRLELRPAFLGNNITRWATEAQAAELRALFHRLTGALDSALTVRDRDDGWMEVALPDPGTPREIVRPPEVKPVGRTRPLAPELARRRPETIVARLPAALGDGKAVDLGGVDFMGALLPEKVPSHHGVVVELYLRARRAPSRRHIVVLSGAQRGTSCTFAEGAEPGDWSVPTSRWQPGEIVRHTVELRGVGECGAGVFDLDVALSPTRGTPSTKKARVGTFQVYPTSRRRLALVAPTIPFLDGHTARPGPALADDGGPSALVLGGTGAAVLALAFVVGWFASKRGRRAAT